MRLFELSDFDFRRIMRESGAHMPHVEMLIKSGYVERMRSDPLVFEAFARGANANAAAAGMPIPFPSEEV